jgi:hypothetical protein
MGKQEQVELTGLWSRGNGGANVSGIVMDDRLTDLFLMRGDGPVKFIIKPNLVKKSPKSPDAYLWAEGVK